MTELNKIKARLGSIAPTMMRTLPLSVQRLLEQDIPKLIDLVEAFDIADGLDEMEAECRPSHG